MEEPAEQRRRSNYKKLFLVGLVLIIVLFLFPMPTPELAVRKELLLKRPGNLLNEAVHLPLPGEMLKSDQQMWYVHELERPFFMVKKTGLGYFVTSSNTAP